MNNTLTNSTLDETDLFLLRLSSTITTSIQIISLSLGLAPNIYVIVLLIRAGGLDASVVLRLSHAVSEIFYALQAPLFILCHVNMRNLCFLVPITFFSSVCLTNRFMFQCCVCFEHYLAVVQPVLFMKYKSMKYRLASLVFVWTYSLTCAIIYTKSSFNLPFNFFLMLFIIFLSMHLFFCFSILIVLRRPRPGERERTQEGGNIVKKKAFKIVSFNLLLFLIQTIPTAAAFSIKFMLPSDAFSLAFVISMNINTAAGIVQPIFMLYQMGKLTCCA